MEERESDMEKKDEKNNYKLDENSKQVKMDRKQ